MLSSYYSGLSGLTRFRMRACRTTSNQTFQRNVMRLNTVRGSLISRSYDAIFRKQRQLQHHVMRSFGSFSRGVVFDPIINQETIDPMCSETPDLNRADVDKPTVRRPLRSVFLESNDEFYEYFNVHSSHEEPVGFGTFGKVYRCSPTDMNHAPHLPSKTAVKIMQKRSQPFYKREVEMLKRIRDTDSCIQVLQVLESTELVYIVTELLEGGDLFDYIAENNFGLGNLSIEACMLLTRQILLCLETCHLQNLAHLDIKPENFVFRRSFDTTKPQVESIMENQLVLVDFGAAQPFKLLPFAQDRLSYQTGMDEVWSGDPVTKIGGTTAYISPEVFLQNRFSSRSDIWSLGVSMFMFLTGERPFKVGTENCMQKLMNQEVDLALKGKRGDSVFANSKALCESIPQDVRNLLVSMTESNPLDRPSSTEALQAVNDILSGLHKR